MAFESDEELNMGDTIPFHYWPQTFDRMRRTRLKDQVYNPLAPFQPMKPYSFTFNNVKIGWRSRGDWRRPPYPQPWYVSEPYKTDIVLVATRDPVNPAYSDTYDTALNNMYKKMSRQKAQAMVSFLERRKTANMLLDRSKMIARTLHSLWRFDVKAVIKDLGLSKKHAKSKHARRLRRYRTRYQRKHGKMPDARIIDMEPRLQEALGSVSGFYMEVRYGFRPLLKDMDDTMTALAEIPQDGYFNVTGGCTSKNKVIQQEYDDGNTQMHNESDIESTLKCSVTVKSTCDFAHWVSKYGLDDVLSTAYEVVPLSWMLDWVLPIGPYLKNANAVSSLSVQQFCLTEFTRYKSTASYSQVSTYPHYGSSSTGTSEGVKMNRVVLSLPPVPLPVFKLDGLAKAWHIADAIGLLTSAILGPKGQLKKYRI